MNCFQSAILLLIFQMYLGMSESKSPIDCNFDESTYCGWKKLNFSSRDYRKRLLSYNKNNKKNIFSKNFWKLTSKIKNTLIRDITDNIS